MALGLKLRHQIPDLTVGAFCKKYIAKQGKFYTEIYFYLQVGWVHGPQILNVHTPLLFLR